MQPSHDLHPPDFHVPEDPKISGRWELLQAQFQGAATHAALLNTHRVFAYGGSALDPGAITHPAPAEILDLATLKTYPVSMEGVTGDIWCGGQTFMDDGRLLFVGGTSTYPPTPDPFFGGLRDAYLFDPADERWTRLPDMHEGRWYPTLVRLTDNSVLSISGLQFRDPKDAGDRNFLRILWHVIFRMREHLVDVQEVYRPDIENWEVMQERRVFPLYPRLHLLPDGDVFYSGVFNTHYFTPGRYPSARWDHHSGMWRELGGRHRDKNREEGISLLLALRPPDYKPRVLIAGGGAHNLPRTIQGILHELKLDSWAKLLDHFATARNSVEWIDPDQDGALWQPGNPLHIPRIHAVGVLLPDGSVAAVGGMPGHGHGEVEQNVDYPVLPPEIYDPRADTWTMMAMPQRPRAYHSTALLLPDGRVISMGGNPQPHVIEHSIEIFSPPYLFRSDRPVIIQVPSEISYQETFSVEVDRARQVAQVVLMRPEALTHVTNTDQRLLELAFSALGEDKLEVQSPLSRAHMPQGFALLFVLNQDGTPSVGRFIRVV